MRRTPSAGTAAAHAAAAGNPSRTHRPARALAAAIRPMSMRPRMQTAIIISRLRSKAARIPYPVRNPFPRRRILCRLPPKRWRVHFRKQRLPQMANSPIRHAKQPCRPAPDVRRDMWQHQRAMQHPRQEKQRPMRRIIPQERCSPSWAARSRRIRSRNNPYIPNRNPIRAAAQRCRIMLARFRSVRREKWQEQIRRAVLLSQPAPQESRITAAAHMDRSHRPNPHSSAAPSCSQPMHNEVRPEWQLPQTQRRTSLRLRLLPRTAQHTLSAMQEYQTIRMAVNHKIRKRNLFNSAVPLCRLRTWQARSQQQNIRLHLFLRDPVWQEIRLCRTAAHRQFPHKTVWQENSQILIPHRPAIAQELVRGRSNRAVRRIRQRPVRQERSARPSAGVIPSRCSRRRAFLRMETPRSRSRTMFLPSSPTAQHTQPAESVWMAAPQIGSILRPRRRYPRQRRLPTAKLVHLRARPRGLIRRVKRSSTLRSAQSPRKAAAQKSHRKLLRIRLPLLPNGRAGNRRPRLLWEA